MSMPALSSCYSFDSSSNSVHNGEKHNIYHNECTPSSWFYKENLVCAHEYGDGYWKSGIDFFRYQTNDLVEKLQTLMVMNLDDLSFIEELLENMKIISDIVYYSQEYLPLLDMQEHFSAGSVKSTIQRTKDTWHDLENIMKGIESYAIAHLRMLNDFEDDIMFIVPKSLPQWFSVQEIVPGMYAFVLITTCPPDGYQEIILFTDILRQMWLKHLNDCRDSLAEMKKLSSHFNRNYFVNFPIINNYYLEVRRIYLSKSVTSAIDLSSVPFLSCSALFDDEIDTQYERGNNSQYEISVINSFETVCRVETRSSDRPCKQTSPLENINFIENRIRVQNMVLTSELKSMNRGLHGKTRKTSKPRKRETSADDSSRDSQGNILRYLSWLFFMLASIVVVCECVLLKIDGTVRQFECVNMVHCLIPVFGTCSLYFLLLDRISLNKVEKNFKYNLRITISWIFGTVYGVEKIFTLENNGNKLDILVMVTCLISIYLSSFWTFIIKYPVFALIPEVVLSILIFITKAINGTWNSLNLSEDENLQKKESYDGNKDCLNDDLDKDHQKQIHVKDSKCFDCDKYHNTRPEDENNESNIIQKNRSYDSHIESVNEDYLQVRKYKDSKCLESETCDSIRQNIENKESSKKYDNQCQEEEKDTDQNAKDDTVNSIVNDLGTQNLDISYQIHRFVDNACQTEDVISGDTKINDTSSSKYRVANNAWVTGDVKSGDEQINDGSVDCGKDVKEIHQRTIQKVETGSEKETLKDMVQIDKNQTLPDLEMSPLKVCVSEGSSSVMHKLAWEGDETIYDKDVSLKSKKEQSHDETMPKYTESNFTDDESDLPPPLSTEEIMGNDLDDYIEIQSTQKTQNGKPVCMCTDDIREAQVSFIDKSRISVSERIPITVGQVKININTGHPTKWSDLHEGLAFDQRCFSTFNESYVKSYQSGDSMDSDSLKSEKNSDMVQSIDTHGFVHHCNFQQTKYLNSFGYTEDPHRKIDNMEKPKQINLEKKSMFFDVLETTKKEGTKILSEDNPKNCEKSCQKNRKTSLRRAVQNYFRRKKRSNRRIFRRTIGVHRNTCRRNQNLVAFPIIPSVRDVAMDSSHNANATQSQSIGNENGPSVGVFRPPPADYSQVPKNSLHHFFAQVLSGVNVEHEEKMRFELLRVQSFQDLPASCAVSPLKMAKTGFFSSGINDEVTCFSCGGKYKNWKLKEDPQTVHSRISPECRMVNNRESRNVPANTQGNGIIEHSPEQDLLRNEPITNGLPQPSIYQDGGFRTNVSSQQFNSQAPAQNGNTLTRDQIQNANVPDQIPRNQIQQPEAVQQYSGRPIDRANSVLEGEQNRPPRSDMADELGITLERPKYPAYAQLNVRISTYQGWPGYLDQTPRDMALAGFFYAGYNDYCRCFFCGGGLRNWDAGDDPWVEHARWFPKCAFVRQNRGHRFVEIIVKRQAEMQASGNTSGSAKNQTPVTTQPETSTQNRPIAQQPTIQTPVQPGVTSSNIDTAVASVREMGYSDDTIQRAMDIIKRGNPDKERIEATELLEMVFTIADDDQNTQTNTAVASENTPTSVLNQGQSGQKKPVSRPSQSSPSKKQEVKKPAQQTTSTSQAANTQESSLPSLSVSSLEHANATGSVGKSEQTGANKEITENEIRSLQEENIQLKEQVLCKICMDKNVSIAFLPCGHLACCIDCAPAMRKCPMCRVYIKGTVKTYLA